MTIFRSILSVLLLASATIDYVKGVAAISPSGVAPVCQVGDQLELLCTVTGMVLSWEFTVISGSMTYTTTPVTSLGPSGVPQPVMINSTRFTFSRLSVEDDLPLMSRITISPVSVGLNGTIVSCREGITSKTEATTTIQIIDPRHVDEINSELGIQSHSEQFTRERVTVILEWILSNMPSYYRQLLWNVSVNVVPDLEVVIRYNGNISIQLTLEYNTLYNVSVTQPGICGQPNQTAYIQLNYNKCSNPLELTHENMVVVGYEDPALEGQNVTFTCPTGSIVSGPTSSTCMGNGEWEPDPREVSCVNRLVTAGTTISSCSDPLYLLQIHDSVTTVKESKFDTTGMCCSGFLITRANTTTCLENGEWELQMKNQGISDPANAMLRTALISITCVLVVITALMFIVGLVCGHYLSQRCRKSANKTLQHQEPASNSINERVEDLDLKENVAYITLPPR